MDIEEERKAFEGYVLSLSKYKKRSPKFIFDLDENGDYDNQDIYELHHAWQASANRESFVLVNAEQLNQWGHMANAAEQYGCCECFESRGYAHNLACEISSYFEPTVEQEQSNESN